MAEAASRTATTHDGMQNSARSWHCSCRVGVLQDGKKTLGGVRPILDLSRAAYRLQPAAYHTDADTQAGLGTPHWNIRVRVCPSALCPSAPRRFRDLGAVSDSKFLHIVVVFP